MPSFSTASGSSTSFTDTTPGTGVVIDMDSLDNSFNIQINGVQLFVGGPGAAPNELEFQTSATAGQTVRFADGDLYGADTQEIWQLGNTNGEPVVRLEINPDGTIALWGVKVANGRLFRWKCSMACRSIRRRLRRRGMTPAQTRSLWARSSPAPRMRQAISTT